MKNQNVDQETLQNLLAISFSRRSERDLFLIAGEGERLSYGDAFSLVTRIAARLAKNGFAVGERICSSAALSLESILLAWACFQRGLVFVPLDHTLPGETALNIIKELDPALVFTDRKPADSWPKAIMYDGCDDGSSSNVLLFSAWLDESQIPSVGGDEIPLPTVTPDTTAIILSTSGSTGKPKGVMLSHGALFRSGRLVAELFEWSERDVFLNLGDLHSMSGFRNTCIAPLHAGCAVVLAEERSRNTPLLIPEIAWQCGCTFIGASPIAIRQWDLAHSSFDPAVFSQIRAVLSTGSGLDPGLIKRFYERTGVPVLNYYGLTETCGLCAGHGFATFNPDDASIGPPIGAELMVKDEELMVKSKNLMQGYYRNPGETMEMFDGDWLHTGDIAEIRNDGSIELKGRIRHIIKNAFTDLVHLEEVELILERHPLIREAAVLGYMTEHGEERMAAFLAVNPEADPSDNARENAVHESLERYALEKLGMRKAPHRYYFFDSLPRNSNGKIRYESLKETMKGRM